MTQIILLTHNVLSTVPVPTLMITANVTGSVSAGTPLNLTCDYTLSPSVDTDTSASAVWTVNGTAVVVSEDGRVSSDGLSLIFSPLTTSDTGRYTCTLTLSPQTPHVTVQGPAHSEEEVITVQSKLHSILHVMIIL